VDDYRYTPEGAGGDEGDYEDDGIEITSSTSPSRHFGGHRRHPERGTSVEEEVVIRKMDNPVGGHEEVSADDDDDPDEDSV